MTEPVKAAAGTKKHSRLSADYPWTPTPRYRESVLRRVTPAGGAGSAQARTPALAAAKAVPRAKTPWKPEHAISMSAPLRTQQHTQSPHRYWWLHGSEKIAGATLEGLEKRGTSVGTLAKGRYWTVGGLRVDPNRWLTPAGAEDHVRSKNRGKSEAQIQKTLQILNTVREQFLPRMQPGEGGAIISAHNSNPSVRYKGKTIFDHEHQKSQNAWFGDSDEVDFIIVTDKADFDAAYDQNVPFNIFYQPFNPEAKDDGSASYLASKEGWRYFNPEVSLRKGAEEKQKAMVDWIESLNQ
jgi:hypothetical protein